MAIIQVHWQNRDDLKQTDFVAQSADLDDVTALMEWAQEVIKRRFNECPEGWTPLVCTEDAPMFVKMVSPGSARLID